MCSGTGVVLKLREEGWVGWDDAGKQMDVAKQKQARLAC